MSHVIAIFVVFTNLLEKKLQKEAVPISETKIANFKNEFPHAHCFIATGASKLFKSTNFVN